MVSTSARRLVLFVRHGNTFEAGETARFIGSRGDPSLTNTGREQAKKVGDLLSKIGFTPDLILCGPRKRQLETASEISDCFKNRTDLKPIEIPLFEELDYGAWEGLSDNEIISRWPDEFEAWQNEDRWPDHIFVTSKPLLLNSIKGWLMELCTSDNLNTKLLVVTSNGILRLIFEILNLKGISTISKVKTGHLCAIEIAQGKINPLFWNLAPNEQAEATIVANLV